MKIVLVNYRYFVSGGPERYFFNIKELLEKKGHQVIPFSIKGTNNEPSDYEDYFLESVGDEAYFAKTKKTPVTVFKSFSRMFYSHEAYRKFRRLLRDTKPDLVYIMQYHNKISPSILYASKKEKIPVVHRISDFQYMCPNALFHNGVDVCEDCLNGHCWSCVKNKCVLDSRIYSLIKASAKLLHDKLHITDKIEQFVVPSTFTLSKLAQYGIPTGKLNHLPTFFNLKDTAPEVSYEPFALFVGRLEPQKGLMTLIKAFEGSGMNLKIIGFSNNGYDQELKNHLKGKSHNIEFLGKMDFSQIEHYLRLARFTIVPSEWYDNFPNSVLESFAFKKPVVATDFGSLPELVVNNKTGLLFKRGDSDDLREKSTLLMDDQSLARELGDNAFNALSSNFTPEIHYRSLMKIFDKAKTAH